MGEAFPRVSVIIPTLAAPERAASIRRALASVVEQSGVDAEPIVVINGPAPDPEIVAWLQRDRRILVLRQPQADLPAAIRLGLGAVAAEFFTELDDDDALLPGALALRLATLAGHPGASIVVTNGFRRLDGVDTPLRPDFAAVRPDPLMALLSGNWLLPGSWLARTDGVPATLFDAMPRYLECTYLAVRFSQTGRVCFDDRPTVVWTQYGGESRSLEFHLGQPDALEAILRLDLPIAFRRGLERHLAAAYHAVAERYRASGQLAKAWRAHLRSLTTPSGWRFLPATRHLVTDWARRPRQ
ncbi:MAG: glycosyltransferase family 2 protein [Gemmatimonadetes bacterium]|nr:glycosyltransferase family 2 protein [Gemmatimonadota bacterium]